MLRVMLIDDERLARQSMRQLLTEHPQVTIVAEAENIIQAQKLIQEHKPDALFLDVQMPGADGFQLLEKLEPVPKTIFVTAHAKHAVKAFEVHAIDYLLKPVRPERLAQTLARLGAESSLGKDTQVYRPNDKICLHTPGWTTVASLSDIVLLKADGDFTRFFIEAHPSLLICQPLGSYEPVLPSPPFLRVDRSLILNLERIISADQISRDEAHLKFRGLNEPVTLGRTAWSRLKKSGFWGA